MMPSNTNSFLPRIITKCEHSDEPYNEILNKTVANILKRATTSDIKHFNSTLPLITWSDITDAPCNFSFYLCCIYRPNAYRFFYEMVSRWLIPGKRLNALLQFAVDFSIPELGNQIYIGGEVVLKIDNNQDLRTVKKNLPVLENEIRLGLESFYQACRILEIKGLTTSEKTALIQENISALIRHRPQDFDYDIFTEMQHFLVICKDEFKAMREYRHMSRIICVHYLFRKALQHSKEAFPERRYINLKIFRAHLFRDGEKMPILGLVLGLSFLQENEVFEERHIVNAIKMALPHVRSVVGSYFVNAIRSDNAHLIYLEIEKEDSGPFSIDEVENIRQFLPNELKNRIEKRFNPIFMPQNEEEVMRDILTLSNELKYLRDLPQVIISFAKQVDNALEFLVIVVRIVKKLDSDLVFSLSDLEFISERVKTVGFIRKKYRKEAAVFRVRIDSADFLRQDHSVDLYKARHQIALELQKNIGEFRDYNGGMISKEAEAFSHLKKTLGKLIKDKEFLLENYFYSFTPAIMRSVLETEHLKNLFTMILDVNKDSLNEKNGFLYKLKKENGYLYLLFAAVDPSFKDFLLNTIEKLEIPSFNIATTFVNGPILPCLAVLYKPMDIEEQYVFIQAIERTINNWKLQVSFN